jgi:hypothetical protein
VAAFISAVKISSTKMKVADQLTAALDITNNDLLGAVNLCWSATRFMARGADQRAYPHIAMNVQELRDWNKRVAQFETHTGSGKNDGPGDNYYFWTHAFGAIIFSQRRIGPALAQVALSKGTQIMAYVRKNIASEHPTISEHQPASELGRAVGLTIASLSDHGGKGGVVHV